jgi:predicted AAA+ superfamily ATPase
MTHIRKRYLTLQILARLKISPVVAIQGARQTGKSLLARELLQEKITTMSYRTLDKKSDRDFAISSPDSFLAQHDSLGLFVIDEVQKAPELFDAIKASVDENRKPGRFLLLGSTEFSLLQRIRESLTGRMSRVRLHPFTISESLKNSSFIDWNFANLKIKHRSGHAAKVPRCSRSELLKYLQRGGMPGLFFIREDEIRNQMMRDWLDLTVQRDLMQISKLKLSPDLASMILEKLATLESPTAGEIAKCLTIDVRKIQTHLKSLASLFVVTKVEPFAQSTGRGHGKERWYLLDTAFVKLLGGSFRRQLQTWILNEILVSNSMRKNPRKINFFRNSKGSVIDFILTEEKLNVAIQVFDRESVYDRDLNLLRSFGNKFPGSILLALAGSNQDHFAENLFVRPWEWLS